METMTLGSLSIGICLLVEEIRTPLLACRMETMTLGSLSIGICLLVVRNTNPLIGLSYGNHDIRQLVNWNLFACLNPLIGLSYGNHDIRQLVNWNLFACCKKYEPLIGFVMTLGSLSILFACCKKCEPPYWLVVWKP
ncbi:hypothetical protein CEXT_396481 [Caerostris extrusa]|uniref:Uncharacterized protein n=1 Tax=Caerostris extrusa TaxID=172846 RepID=A0AAV4TMH1_CAEEX|nr:hypothetical protein CEXT_396481 [Caerostris extrusa]